MTVLMWILVVHFVTGVFVQGLILKKYRQAAMELLGLIKFWKFFPIILTALWPSLVVARFKKK